MNIVIPMVGLGKRFSDAGANGTDKTENTNRPKTNFFIINF